MAVLLIPFYNLFNEILLLKINSILKSNHIWLKTYYLPMNILYYVKKFIMLDIVSLAFDIKNMSLDGELINKYVSLLSDKLFFDRNPSFRILWSIC